MFDISNELSTKTIKRLYYYSVTVFLFKKTSFKYSQRLIEVLPAIIRTVQNKRLASICSNEKWRRNKKACRSYDNF
jgi:hypothetical protein